MTPRRRIALFAAAALLGCAAASSRPVLPFPTRARAAAARPDGPPRRSTPHRGRRLLPRPDRTLVPLLQPDRDAEQGLLFIPGVTLSFVPIADLVGRDLVVPTHLAYPGAAEIWIDWGRFRHDPLESLAPPASPLPCDTPNRQPHLDIRVTAGSTPDAAAAGTLTLELARYDRNRLPLNPTWAGGGPRDLCRSCDGLRLERRPDGRFWIPGMRSARCTLQRPALDWGGCSPALGALSGGTRSAPRARSLGPHELRAGHVHRQDLDGPARSGPHRPRRRRGVFSGAGRRRARPRAAGGNQVPRADRPRVLDGRERSGGFARRGGGGSRSGT